MSKRADAISTLAQTLVGAQTAQFDMNELAGETWKVWGGAAGLAKESKFQYDACEKDGSAAKLNMLRTILDVFTKLHEVNTKSASGQEAAPINAKELEPYLIEFIKSNVLPRPEPAATPDDRGTEPLPRPDGPGDGAEVDQGTGERSGTVERPPEAEFGASGY